MYVTLILSAMISNYTCLRKYMHVAEMRYGKRLYMLTQMVHVATQLHGYVQICAVDILLLLTTGNRDKSYDHNINFPI